MHGDGSGGFDGGSCGDGDEDLANWLCSDRHAVQIQWWSAEWIGGRAASSDPRSSWLETSWQSGSSAASVFAAWSIGFTDDSSSL